MTARRPPPPNEHRCVKIRVNGKRCRNPRSEDGGEYCPWHKKHHEKMMEFRVRAMDMEDIDPLDGLRLLIKQAHVMCQRLELEMLDADVPEMFTILERERRSGGPGGDYTLLRLSDTQRALVLAYRAERAELRQLVQLAIAQGIAERDLKLRETEVGLVLQVLIGFAQRAGLDPEGPEVRRFMIESLREVSQDSEILSLGG